MSSMPWHTQDIRPLTRADVGRFVLGFGLAGSVAGYVEILHTDYLVIDTGRTGGPLNGNVVVDVVQTYTFVDLPEWVRESKVSHGAP